MLKNPENYLKVLIGGITYEPKIGTDLNDYVLAIFVDILSNRSTAAFHVKWNRVVVTVNNIYDESINSLVRKIQDAIN